MSSSSKEKRYWLGTKEEDFCWCNLTDQLSYICVSIVYFSDAFIVYSATLFYQQDYLSLIEYLIFLLFFLMSLWCHIKVMTTDPGAVPKNAKPLILDKNNPYIVCGRCDSYKPSFSHHDRISNRCICRMDHYCPWTNNAIGAGNQKHFILFLIYTDISSIYLYILVTLRLISFPETFSRPFEGIELIYARCILFILLFSLLFTSSMILNQWYGLSIGLGTIDRMKGKHLVEKPSPVPFKHVFGDQYWSLPLPIDPVFKHPEMVFYYKNDDSYIDIL